MSETATSETVSGRPARPVLACHVVGDTLLLQPDGTDQPALRSFAASLAPDPGHSVVVMTLIAGDPAVMWEPVLPELDQCPHRLRLVPGSPMITSTLPYGQFLADRLGRSVLAQDGPALAAARGALFIPAVSGSGWLELRPGQAPAPGSRRFPTPAWACAALETPGPLSASAAREPLPGGAWIRPATPADAQEEHRQRLISWLAWRDDRVYVVLGQPGAPPVDLPGIERFWRSLPPDVRAAVRFVPYGPVAVPGEVPLGQALATALGEPVGMSTGLPWSGRAAADLIHVRALRADSSPGWLPFATELEYRPAGVAGVPGESGGVPGESGAAGSTPPVVTAYRTPVPGMAEVSPSVYAHADGTVAEVVPAGLWLRPEGPAAGSTARSHPLVPEHALIFVDPAAAGDELRSVTTLISSLEPEISASCQVREAVAVPSAPPVLPASAELPAIRLESGPRRATAVPGSPAGGGLSPGSAGLAGSLTGLDTVPPAISLSPAGPVPAADPVPPAAVPQTEVVPAARAARRGPRVQPVPPPEACVIPPARGLDQERAWLRKTLSRQYDATASLVGRVVAENPGIRSESGVPSADLVTDLVALRLYLSGQARQIDDAVRTGKVGPHVPFGRCVAAGLRRLPSYRGPARLRATLADAEWQWYHGRRVVTEWAFCSALASGQAELPGTVEFRIWSMTGRRTSLLEPQLPSQVLFLPGTNFKVLQVNSDGHRQVLLRELASNEIEADGRIVVDRVPLDEIALTGLENAAATWQREIGPEGELPAGYEHRFGNPPGLIVKAGAPVARHAAETAAPGQAVT